MPELELKRECAFHVFYFEMCLWLLREVGLSLVISYTSPLCLRASSRADDCKGRLFFFFL